MKPSFEEVHLLFKYEPKTGKLIRRISVASNAKAGFVVGCLSKNGYLTVGIRSVNYFVHRIIWLMMTGDWAETVDHKNLIKTDNTWKNLRLATYSQNNANTCLRIDNTSGHKGIVFDAKRNKYRARINFKGVSKYIGRYDTIQEAAMAYQKSAKIFFGEYARF